MIFFRKKIVRVIALNSGQTILSGIFYFFFAKQTLFHQLIEIKLI